MKPEPAEGVDLPEVKPTSNNQHLLPALILYQHRRRDAALGLGQSGQKMRALLSYYLWSQLREQQISTEAVYSKGVLEGCREQIDMLMAEAETCDPKDRQDLLTKALAIQTLAEAAADKLAMLSDKDFS